MVESAFVFLGFFMMVVGTFDFGQFLFIHHALTERVRYAARWGAINSPNSTDAIRNMVLYNQSTVPSGTPSGYFGLTTSNVSVTILGANTVEYRILVTVQNYQFSMLSPYIARTYTGKTISAVVPLFYT